MAGGKNIITQMLFHVALSVNPKCCLCVSTFRFGVNVQVARSDPVLSDIYLYFTVWRFLFQSDGFLKDNNNAAQRLLDGVKYISQSVSELSVKPAKAVTSWLTDQIAPAYWKPNSLILVFNILC